MKKLLMLVVLMGITTTLFSQVEEVLPEVKVLGLHFKYIDAINDIDEPVVIKDLHKYVGNFDVLESDVYDVVYDTYQFTFKIPQGKILAGYDDEGNLLWTVEQFKNVKVPNDIVRMVAMEYPNWKFEKTFYTIKYTEKSGASKKYRVIISKDGKKKRITLDPDEGIL